MLALTPVAAVKDGTGPSQKVRRTGGATDVSNNPFIKMLAGLQASKAAALASPKPADAAGAAGSRAVKANGAADKIAGSANAANAKQALDVAKRGQAKPETASARTAPAVAKAVADAANADKKQIEPANRRDEKVRRPSDSTGDEQAAAIAAGIAARPAAKAEPNRLTQAPNGTARGEEKDSGMETLGTKTETLKNGAKLTIVDMRLKAARDAKAGDGSEPKNAGDASASEKGKAGGSDATAHNSGERFVIADSGQKQAAPEAAVAKAPMASGSFAESLAARLRDGAADIVRSAQIVLQNGNSGVIRLRLEPESLGGVKIELRMAEKQISGTIVVESDIAGEAFRSSIDALKDAFAESGFETTSLSVEVRNGMASEAQSGGGASWKGSDGNSDGPYFSRSLRELDAAVPSAAIASGGRSGALDMIV